jgi:hypothetical protein
MPDTAGPWPALKRPSSNEPIRRAILDPSFEDEVFEVEAAKRQARLADSAGGRIAQDDPRRGVLNAHLTGPQAQAHGGQGSANATEATANGGRGTEAEGHEADEGPASTPAGGLDFAWGWSETLGYAKEVKTGQAMYLRCCEGVEEARKRLLSKMTGKMRAWFETALDEIDARLIKLRASKISLADRQAALQEVEQIDSALANLLALASARLSDAEKRRAVEEQRAEEQERIRLAEEAAAAEREQKRLAEEKARLEEEKRKAEEEAAAARKEKERKEAEDAERLRQEQEKAEQERQQQEAEAEEERKRQEAAAEEESKRQKAEAEAESKRQAEEAERVAREQEAQERADAYGAKGGALAAASQVSRELAEQGFVARIQQLQAALEKELQAAKSAAPKKKAVSARSKSSKGNRGKQPAVSTEPEPTSPAVEAANTAFETGTKEAEKEREQRSHASVMKLAGVANSAAGKALSDTDLAWAINASSGKVELAQGLADLSAEKPDGLEVAHSLASRPDCVALIPICLRLVRIAVPAKQVVDAAQLLQGREQQAFGTWFMDCVSNGATTKAIEWSKQFPKNLSLVAQVIPMLGFSNLADDFLKLMITTKAPSNGIATLLALHTDQSFKLLVQAIENKNLDVVKVCSVVAPGNLQRFTLGELVRLCNSCYGQLGMVPAVLAAADDHCPSFVELVINSVNGDMSNAPLVAAFRAEGLLTDGIATMTVTLQQADTQYYGGALYRQRNIDMGARTGFVTITFPNGSTVDVHTHWDSRGTAKGIVTSMHVQIAGGNGLELNTWKQFFPRLPQAVINAQNNATTKPTGGKLTVKLT